jgi:PTS system galactitol-specific IIC component
MTKFVASTGIQLTITDLGWAPLATITWGSPYTLFFLLIMVLVDIVMIVLDRTNTIDVDVFDIWHLAFVGLACMYFGAPLWVATLLVVFIGVLKIMNSDVMRPTFNDLIDAPGNPMTTTHMNYMMNPIIMVFNKFFDRFLPGLDRYDFDAAKLNEKVGFWGSKFSIGICLGIFVGLLAHEDIKSICTLAFTAAVCLELFSLIGAWFIEAIEPLSPGHLKLRQRNGSRAARSTWASTGRSSRAERRSGPRPTSSRPSCSSSRWCCRATACCPWAASSPWVSRLPCSWSRAARCCA